MQIETIEIQKIHTGELCESGIDGLVHRKELPFFSVVQATEGAYDIRLDQGDTENTGEGGIFLAPSHVLQTITHHTNPTSDRMQARWVFLEVLLNGVYMPDSLYRFPVLVPKAMESACSAALDEIFRAEHPCDRMIGAYRLEKLLLAIAEPKTARRMPGLARVEQYIRANYQKKITVAELSGLLSMSESNFHALFKKNFGMAPIAYINRYRLSVATLLLHDSDLSMQAIAERVGFYDQFYFSRSFKRAFGVSPSEYRAGAGALLPEKHLEDLL